MGTAEPLYSVTVGQPRLRNSESEEDPGFGVLRHYLFELRVQSRFVREPWVLDASYEDAAALNGGLRERHGAEAVPAYPRKRHVSQFFYKEEAEYLEEIRAGLQTYFTAILASSALRMDPEVRHFLGLQILGPGKGDARPLQPAAQQPPSPPAAPQPDAPNAAVGGHRAAPEAPFRVTLLEADSQDSYFLRVQATEVPGLRWSLVKSLAAMASLHDILAARHALPAPPAFPRTRSVTKYLVYGSSSAYREALREDLERYFEAILGQEPLRCDADVRSFLELDEHAPQPRHRARAACERCIAAIKRMLRLGPRAASRDLTVALRPQ